MYRPKLPPPAPGRDSLRPSEVFGPRRKSTVVPLSLEAGCSLGGDLGNLPLCLTGEAKILVELKSNYTEWNWETGCLNILLLRHNRIRCTSHIPLSGIYMIRSFNTNNTDVIFYLCDPEWLYHPFRTSSTLSPGTPLVPLLTRSVSLVVHVSGNDPRTCRVGSLSVLRSHGYYLTRSLSKILFCSRILLNGRDNTLAWLTWRMGSTLLLLVEREID